MKLWKSFPIQHFVVRKTQGNAATALFYTVATYGKTPTAVRWFVSDFNENSSDCYVFFV